MSEETANIKIPAIEFGLIGNPLEQSFSPELHQLFADYDYQLCPIKEADLQQFMKERKFRGINVTIPYKQAVIPYLDQIDGIARQIGAVNTIVNKNRKLFGCNTDFAGMAALFKRASISLRQKKVLILGSGGTSKTAFVLAKTQRAAEIYRVSRQTPSGANFPQITYAEALTDHSDAEIIINTTPCGMHGKLIGQTSIDLNDFPRLEAVVDAIYNPLRTQLMLEAEKRQIKTCGGLFMLVAQAYYASALFRGKDLSELFADQKSVEPSSLEEASECMENAFRKLLRQKQNIVLSGMPSSGKTAIGQLIAASAQAPFIDIDHLIEQKFGRSPAEIIRTDGESEFRQKEKEVIFSLRERTGLVIATGGGSVLDPQNVDALKANGKIYFLDRKLEDLTPTASRPLSPNRMELAKLFAVRRPVYQKTADVTIMNNQPAEDIAKEILAYE